MATRPRLSGRSTSTLAVETAGAQQRRVENFRAICGRKDDEAAARVETIHLDQKLVERLLLLVVAAIGAEAAGAPERVELIDEDDGRRLGTRLLEQVAHARGADADKHLHKLGAGDGEERHFGLPGDGLGEQCLAGSGRPDQEDAFRHPRAEAAILLRIFQKIDDLAQLVLGLVDPGDIVEANAGVGLHVDLRLALADRHQAAAQALGHTPRQKHPHTEEQQGRNDPGEKIGDQRAFHFPRKGHAVFLQLISEARVDARGHELGFAIKRFLQPALDVTVGNADLSDLVVAQQLLELAIGDGGDLLRRGVEVLQRQQPENRGNPVADVETGLPAHVLHRHGRKPSRSSPPGAIAA
jgi:hypothetical protein